MEENDTSQVRFANIAEMPEWRCAFCTLLNSNDYLSCAACDALQPAAANQFATAPDFEENVNYAELMEISRDPLVFNTKKFYCTICMSTINEGEGVVLKECLHSFCCECLTQAITVSSDPEIKCPFVDEESSCDSILLQSEIKALVPETVFGQYLSRGVNLAEAQMKNSIHCKTTDCPGWVIIEEGTTEFVCPVCKHGNCVKCQAVHDGLDCISYKASLDPRYFESAQLVQRLLKNGRAMVCPRCSIIIQKNGGCDGVDCGKCGMALCWATKGARWGPGGMVNEGSAMMCPTCGVAVVKDQGCASIICTMCKTYLCWATKGPRWGPGGVGDTSGGCRCYVNGVRCHPSCNNCH